MIELIEKLIVVDWGTTSFRVLLVDEHGKVVSQNESKSGVQFITDGDFEPVLLNAISPWLTKYGPVPIIALGMVTGKNGWIEVPYISCPASLEDLAKGAIHRKISNKLDIYFLAGLTDKNSKPFPDVMRGEETQVAGFGLDQKMTVVLPGTHSKWVKVGGGEITKFQTFVTGEIYSLLSEYSFIAKSITPFNALENWAIFDHGVQTARGSHQDDYAFLSQLFAVRTGMLAGEFSSSEITTFLSGFLIGHEFRQALEIGWFSVGEAIGLVGNDVLSARYQRTANMFELNTETIGGSATVCGAQKIFKKLSRSRKTDQLC